MGLRNQMALQASSATQAAAIHQPQQVPLELIVQQQRGLPLGLQLDLLTDREEAGAEDVGPDPDLAHRR